MSLTKPAAAGAVLTDNPSSATIAAAVAAALVAAGISGTTADNGKGEMASATASKKEKRCKGQNFYTGRDRLYAQVDRRAYASVQLKVAAGG